LAKLAERTSFPEMLLATLTSVGKRLSLQAVAFVHDIRRCAQRVRGRCRRPPDLQEMPARKNVDRCRISCFCCGPRLRAPAPLVASVAGCR